jgi:hypothetical protein
LIPHRIPQAQRAETALASVHRNGWPDERPQGRELSTAFQIKTSPWAILKLSNHRIELDVDTLSAGSNLRIWCSNIICHRPRIASRRRER